MDKKWIKDVKDLLDSFGLDYYTKVDGINIHIPAQTIINMYQLKNKIWGTRDQPSTCVSCIINMLNKFIDYLILTKEPEQIVEPEQSVKITEVKVETKKKSKLK